MATKKRKSKSKKRTGFNAGANSSTSGAADHFKLGNVKIKGESKPIKF